MQIIKFTAIYIQTNTYTRPRESSNKEKHQQVISIILTTILISRNYVQKKLTQKNTAQNCFVMMRNTRETSLVGIHGTFRSLTLCYLNNT